jgi:phospholipid/cholesterol/gamma-HCH transport system permease protein
MMLIRYITQLGRYFFDAKQIFSKQTKWSVMRNLIFKEIDDLVIDSLGM